jgi:HAD superfamily hydrolase (TIGR01484 family)
MQYKLIALDIDGTIIKFYGDPISAEVSGSIARARAQGVHVCLVSGKSIVNAKGIIKDLDLLNEYHVLESGAKLIGPDLEVLGSHPIELSEVESTVRLHQKDAAGLGICIGGNWVDSVEACQWVGDAEISSFSFHYKDPDHKEFLLKRLAAAGTLEKFSGFAGGPHWEYPEGGMILLTMKGISKASGLQFIQEKLGIKVEETIAAGDGDNDLPLFERAGLKVAMGNAMPSLKEAADYITDRVEDHGVSKMIEKFIFG